MRRNDGGRLICPSCQSAAIDLTPKSAATFAPSRAPQEGRFAIVTNVGAGCGGRFGGADERRVRRTAKSCGPDAPTLAFKLAGSDLQAMVAKKPGHQGEREGNR
jgi:hypothetical protein